MDEAYLEDSKRRSDNAEQGISEEPMTPDKFDQMFGPK